MNKPLVELKTLGQLKEYLSKLDDSKPIEFQIREGRKLTFYAVGHGGVVSSETKTTMIPQAIYLIEEN